MATKKFFGSKSRRLRDTQEFLDKIKLKEETDIILSKCMQKKKYTEFYQKIEFEGHLTLKTCFIILLVSTVCR